MLNKLQFNNMVISNKKGIQQARIQTINKLVHKIRKLKTLLEKRPEDSKCKERIRKSTETMEHLKKLKRVEIMKCVLLLEKPPASVITNGSSTPEEMAPALLAMNKVMQGLIKRFKLELKLEDSEDAKWREELKENSKRRQKIERTEEKKRKRQALKEQKAMARKRTEWLEQNCGDIKDGGDIKGGDIKDVSISTVPGWKIEEVEDDILPKEVKAMEEKNNVTNIKKENIKRPTPTQNEKTHKKEVPQKKPKTEIRKPVIADQEASLPEEETDNESQPEETVQEDFLPEEETDNECQPEETFKSNGDSEDSETEETTHVVDPFFVTETGENYLSTAVVTNTQNEGNNHEDEEKDRHLIQLNGTKKYTDFRENRRQRRSGEGNFPQKNKWNDEKYPQKQSRFGNDNRREEQRGNRFGNDTSNRRQDQKGNRFGNDNNNRRQDQKPNRFGNENRRQDQQQKQWNNGVSKRTDLKKNEDNADKLHPSWAAKQKLKPVITGFQGKKIVFGDDDNQANETKGNKKSFNMNKPSKDNKSQNVTTNETLHPSWAAKQKQKPVITAFQGKKISFDD
ncbi:rlb1 [Musca autumnalis]|uniref:rlb1 n=1 Tax=Musca autumnalis TaxID=221902 RepID=UPI003CE873C6